MFHPPWYSIFEQKKAIHTKRKMYTQEQDIRCRRVKIRYQESQKEWKFWSEKTISVINSLRYFKTYSQFRLATIKGVK